jgi:hypothetical protein
MAISTDANTVLASGAIFEDSRKVITVAPGKTVDAEESMEAGHKRPLSGAFDLDPMNIHRDIEGAQRRAKREKRQPDRHRRSGNHKRRQQDGKAVSPR